jgi:hypothetical protein
MSGEEPVSIFGQFDAENASGEERQAYQKGYGDYKASREAEAVSVLREPYDPPAGQERAYGAGWERAKKEKEDEDALLAAILPIINL